MPHEKTPSPAHLVITGQSGMGKSTYLVRYLEGSPANCRFIFDGEWKPGADRPELSHRLRIPAATDSAGLIAQIRSGWVCFDPTLMFPGRSVQAADWFAKFTFYASHKIPGRKIFVTDELQKYVANNVEPFAFNLIFDTGRRYGLEVACITSALNRIHNTIRGQITELVAYKTVEDCALKFLVSQGLPKAIKDLPPYEYVAKNLLSGGMARGRVA